MNIKHFEEAKSLYDKIKYLESILESLASNESVVFDEEFNNVSVSYDDFEEMNALIKESNMNYIRTLRDSYQMEFDNL